MRKLSKINKRLDARRADFSKMLNDTRHEGSVKQRLDSGGYIRPGSNKK
jgi:hypothetical protein